MQKNYITLASININGIKDKSKREIVQSSFNKYDDVIRMKETHASELKVNKWRVWPGRDRVSSHRTGASKEVIMFCKKIDGATAKDFRQVTYLQVRFCPMWLIGKVPGKFYLAFSNPPLPHAVVFMTFRTFTFSHFLKK